MADAEFSGSPCIGNKSRFRITLYWTSLGSANFLFRAMMGGSIGGTVSLANSFPAVALELFRYGQCRDEVNGARFQERVTRINQAISGLYGPSGVKAAMNLAGFKGGIPRRPLLPLGAAQVEELRLLLEKEGLLK
jgi:4-hydroxy-2-oxoglutarate aldolase